MDEFCAHRGVSLWFGRNEDHGLRCPYHGWKYDVNGQCVEVPSEPAESGFCKKIKLTSYPCVEMGDVIWIYMGPAEKKPPLPNFEWATVPGAHRFVSKRTQECNWLQALEGGIDSVHVSFLHRHDLRSDPLHVGQGAEFTRETDARFEVIENDGGMVIGVRRPATPGNLYWRITQWVMPFHTMIPPYGDNALNGHAFVPIDDENCMSWCFTYHPSRPLSAHELEVMSNGGGIHVNLIPGSFRPVVNKDNDYMIDRVAQKHHKSYCGVKGIAMQDAAIQESCGPIQDRSKENLVSTDNGVIMARRAAAQGRARRRARQGAGRSRSGNARGALGLNRAARRREFLRSRRRRAQSQARHRARVGVNAGRVLKVAKSVLQPNADIGLGMFMCAMSCRRRNLRPLGRGRLQRTSQNAPIAALRASTQLWASTA